MKVGCPCCVHWLGIHIYISTHPVLIDIQKPITMNLFCCVKCQSILCLFSLCCAVILMQTEVWSSANRHMVIKWQSFPGGWNLWPRSDGYAMHLQLPSVSQQNWFAILGVGILPSAQQMCILPVPCCTPYKIKLTFQPGKSHHQFNLNFSIQEMQSQDWQTSGA